MADVAVDGAVAVVDVATAAAGVSVPTCPEMIDPESDQLEPLRSSSCTIVTGSHFLPDPFQSPGPLPVQTLKFLFLLMIYSLLSLHSLAADHLEAESGPQVLQPEIHDTDSWGWLSCECVEDVE